MNNTFDIKRFGQFALMNYSCHRRQYLGIVAAAVVVMLLNFFNWKFTFVTLASQGGMSPYNRVLDDFIEGFFMAGVLFMWGYIKSSMQGVNGQSLTMHDMLLPVSAFERYLFALINSTVVAVGLYLLLFQLTSSIISPMYLLSDNGYAFSGLWGFKESIIQSGGYDEVCRIGVADVINAIHVDGAPSAIKWNILWLVFISFVSIFMWGEITFQNRGAAVLTILLHGALFGGVVALFVFSDYANQYPTRALNVHYDLGEEIDIERVMICLLYAYNIFPITYQWVVWKKFKNMVVTK